MKTLMMILVSLGVGVGSTLLVQTVIITPPPVVAVVACPDAGTRDGTEPRALWSVTRRLTMCPRAGCSKAYGMERAWN